MDEGRAPEVIYLDFYKAFDTVPYNIFLSKSERGVFYGCTIVLMRNWLDGQIQRAVGNSSESQRNISDKFCPSEPIFRPLLFNIFINYLEKGIQSMPSKLADGTKLWWG